MISYDSSKFTCKAGRGRKLAQVFPQRALTFIYKIILAEQLVPATRPAQERSSQTQAAFLRQLQGS
jgi:hypothetical protein